MSKAKKPEAEVENKAVPAVQDNKAVAIAGGSISIASVQAAAGRGAQNITMNDQSPPYLRVLQALSAQIKKNKAEYVEDAKAGMFYNSATQEVYDGEKGVILIPVHFEKRYLEYTAKEEGKQAKFVTDHGTNPDAIEGLKKEKYSWIAKEGNTITETATYYALHYLPETGGIKRVIISMPSSHAKKSRNWNSLITNRMIPNLDGTPGEMNPPAYFTAYIATVIGESNGDNDWFSWKFAPWKDVLKLESGQLVPNIENGINVFNAATRFADLISGGEIQIQQPAEDDAPNQGNASDAF